VRPALVLSCEHGGNRLPEGFPRTPELDALLPTHRGWDPGALDLARRMARLLRVPLRFSTISRLVVEPNRDEDGGEVFSPWSEALPPNERKLLLARHHRRHRRRVRSAVEAASEGGRRPVVHVGVHTFTPVLDGVERAVDVGILLDPARPLERRVARRWMSALARLRPELRIRENEPYDGRSEGLTTTLRSLHPPGGAVGYAGLELEVGQALLGPDGRFPDPLARELAAALEEGVREGTAPPRLRS
jgi:predicted N-formylglutamate amidohydrolase